MLNQAMQQRHKARNLIHTVLLVGGSLLLLIACAWLMMGGLGVIWALLIGGGSLIAAGRVSPHMVLQMYRGRRLHPSEAPELNGLMRELTARADLPAVPDLYYVASRNMNAFAVGRPENAAIAVTDGLLRGLDLRQLAGVLAHEISHIRNGDLRVMAIADIVSRLTGAMAFTGFLLLIVYSPVMMVSGQAVPVNGILLLMASPTISSLLQLALSRAREYEADLDAAGLTGDPEGLASALVTLERKQGALWERILMPGQRIPDPSILRSHPKTEDRVARLLSLRPEREPVRVPARRPSMPIYFIPAVRPPRFHRTGVWY